MVERNGIWRRGEWSIIFYGWLYISEELKSSDCWRNILYLEKSLSREINLKSLDKEVGRGGVKKYYRDLIFCFEYDEFSYDIKWLEKLK